MRVLFLCLFLCVNGVAQTPYAIHLTKSKGLPTNEIFDIYQDKKGYIWIASQEGLYKFDGIQFKPFTISNQYSKAGNQIREDFYGRLWYITFDGYLYYLKNDSLHQFNSSPGIGTFYYMTDKVLFFLRENKLEIYNLKTLELVQHGFKPNQLLIDGLGLDDQVVLKQDSMISVVNESGKEINKIQAVSKLAALGITFDKNSFISVWDSMLVLVDRQNFRPTRSLIQKSIEPITKMYNYGGNYFLVNRKSGLVMIDSNFSQLKYYFANKRIACVMKDKEGKYWIGTLNDGIYLVSDFNHIVGSGMDMESSYSEIIGNHLFVGTLKGEVHVYDKTNLELVGSYALKERNQVYDFIQLNIDREIFFQDGALSTFSHAGIKTIAAVSGCKELVDLDARYMMMAISGAIVLFDKQTSDTVGAWFNMAKKYHRGRRMINLLQGIRGKSVVCNEKKNIVYAVTNKGLYRFDPLNIREIKYKDQTLNVNRIISYYDTYYLLSNDGSLLQMDKEERITVFKTGLSLQKIKKSEHYLILQSASNLYLMDLQDTQKRIQNLTTNIPLDEIQQVEVSGKQLIYITGTGPLLQSIEKRQVIPLFEIASLNELYFDSLKEYVFPFNSNDMEIAFSVLDYLSPYSHQLAYRINGGDWKNMQAADRVLKLASLQAGQYRVEFMVDQVVQSKKVVFTILRPWYSSYWFLSMIAALIAGSVYFVYRVKSKEEKERNRLLIEKMELEYSLQRSLLSSIKSQMNPHFLFNALNTIQSFILTEDKQLASNYLSKFSKLTRKILEMSERDKVSLAEEKESLELYLDLEKMRFENLEYNIETDIGLSLETIMIPSMILQPYVENAIKHGLLHRKGERRLTIQMRREANNLLRIVIDDNGIGRKRSAELNKIREDKHISFSTKANKKRLEILNNDNPDISVVYKDKIDESGQPAGTSVEITIPIN